MPEAPVTHCSEAAVSDAIKRSGSSDGGSRAVIPMNSKSPVHNT